MRQMKDSGVEWIGEVPESWRLLPAKLFISVGHGSDPHTEGEIPVYGSGQKSFKTCGEYKEGPVILLGRKGSIGNPVLVEGKYWNVDTAFDVRMTSDLCSSKLYYYLALCFDYGSITTQTTIPSAKQSDYLNMLIPLGSKKEQIAITSYLDVKCAKIDRAIEAAEASIEEYKLYKNSVIFKVVTKGLNPKTSLKDSGIEWVSTVPSHWHVPRWKNILIERNETNKDGKVRNILSLSVSQGVVPYSERRGGGNKAKEDLTAYKIAYAGDIVLNSMNVVSGSVSLSAYDGCVSPVYYMYHPIFDSYDVRYFNYVFQTKPFQLSLFGLGNGIMAKESSTGKLNTVRMRISASTLGALPLPCPPASEQRQISDYLDSICVEIDNAVASKYQIIEELKSYKKSLIWEVVTGKREVE